MKGFKVSANAVDLPPEGANPLITPTMLDRSESVMGFP